MDSAISFASEAPKAPARRSPLTSSLSSRQACALRAITDPTVVFPLAGWPFSSTTQHRSSPMADPMDGLVPLPAQQSIHVIQLGSERGGQARGGTLSGGRRRRVLVMLSRFPWRPALSELIGGRRGGVRCNPSRSPLRARAQSFHTTLSESQTYVHEAKKSRFVAVASPVSSAEEAMVRTSSPFSSRTNASDHLLPSPALTDLLLFPL